MRYAVIQMSASLAASGSTAATGSPMDTSSMFLVSAQFSASSGALGSIRLQASNDPPHIRTSAVSNWSDIPSTTVPVSGSGLYLIPSTDAAYNWVRVAYSGSSGSAGSMTGSLKTVGA